MKHTKSVEHRTHQMTCGKWPPWKTNWEWTGFSQLEVSTWYIQSVTKNIRWKAEFTVSHWKWRKHKDASWK